MVFGFALKERCHQYCIDSLPPKSYLTKFLLNFSKFTATKPEDLWWAFSQHVDDTISKLPADLETVMQNWIQRSGFPLLSVEQDGDNIVITQVTESF